MTDVFKKIVTLLTIITIVLMQVSYVYFGNLFKKARDIEDVDHLTGQRIAVVCAYEGDYVLTNRDDITLLRYDSEADAVMALFYKQVDAFATTLDAAEYILNLTTGLKINEKEIESNGMASLFLEDSELIKEFEEFINVFKDTKEYQAYLDRCDNQEYYDGSKITEETGTGKTIKIGYAVDYLPVTFFDTIQNCPNGSEVDIYRYFANYMNYKIEWVKSTELKAYSDLLEGTYEIWLDGYSEVYRDECEAADYYALGPDYRYSKIVLLEVEDYDNISFKNSMWEEE